MMQNLPNASREKLEVYKEADIPFTQFMEKFATVRPQVIEQTEAPVRAVASKPPVKTDEVGDRLDQLESMVKKWSL